MECQCARREERRAAREPPPGALYTLAASRDQSLEIIMARGLRWWVG